MYNNTMNTRLRVTLRGPLARTTVVPPPKSEPNEGSNAREAFERANGSAWEGTSRKKHRLWRVIKAWVYCFLGFGALGARLRSYITSGRSVSPATTASAALVRKNKGAVDTLT